MHRQCLRALLLDEEDEYEEYIAAQTRNILADASDYVSLNNRGVASLEAGETQAALDDFTAARLLAPDDSAPLLNLASAFEMREDLAGALSLATEAVRVAPHESACYFVRRGIYQKLGDKRRAEEDRQNGNKCRIAEGDRIIE